MNTSYVQIRNELASEQLIKVQFQVAMSGRYSSQGVVLQPLDQRCHCKQKMCKAASHQHKSETTSHANEQYHPVEIYTISKAWGLGPNLKAHPNEGVVPWMKRRLLSQAEYGL